MSTQSHYPSFDVMHQKDHWDDHTQSIIADRLVRKEDYHFLTDIEAEVLRCCCSLLIDDHRADLNQYILCHIDQFLSSNTGEGQRKPGVPPANRLIRDGIYALDQLSQRLYVNHFFHLKESEQQLILSDMSSGKNEPAAVAEIWGNVPPKELFNLLLKMTTEAYYSHPLVWSEIGYAGPAYPRGYVRTQGGHLDPWEAKRES